MRRHIRRGISDSDNRTDLATLQPASPLRDTTAPCASGDKCMTDPPMRVPYRGDVCTACLRVRQRMTAQLRARR